jgi:hypothetical protein
MTLDRLIRAATSRIETVRVTRTGINPLLWLAGLVTIPALVLSVLTDNAGLRAALFAVGVLPPIAAIIAYFLLLFWYPDMLQSEEYRLRRHAMLIAFKHGATPEILQATAEIARLESGTAGVPKEEQP